MPIPKIALPKYELTVPSSKLKYQYRPYLVKEEKLLLMAVMSSNKKDFLVAIKDVVKACSLNKNFDCDALTFFDIEYIFLALRARSVGEIEEHEYRCQNKVDDKVCGTRVPVPIDFTKAEVAGEIKNEIRLSNDVTVIMRYPDFDSMEKLNSVSLEEKTGTEILEHTIEFLAEHIAKVITPDGAITAKDVSFEERKEFVLELTKDAFNKLSTFLVTMPKIILKTHFKCPKCQYEEPIVLEGFESFLE